MKAILKLINLCVFGVLIAINSSFNFDETYLIKKNNSINDSTKVDSVLKRAYRVMGTPYKWAGCTPKTGFDCSGYVYWCFQSIGIQTARSSSGLFNMGEKINIEDAEAGDLILFKGTNAKSKGVGHVGIVVSKKGEPLKFVHSSSSKQHWGVIETVYGGSYYIKRFIGIRRVIK